MNSASLKRTRLHRRQTSPAVTQLAARLRSLLARRRPQDRIPLGPSNDV